MRLWSSFNVAGKVADPVSEELRGPFPVEGRLPLDAPRFLWSVTNACTCSEKHLEASKRKFGCHHPLSGGAGEIIGVISIT
ncbi:hypothetical protein AVEN_215733-1 [Araneus ventricosus]|uniref:Uncharacterized protein n=1 Tax=Araneus ventricosus TaxID=182803 RepID=A0A4Y2FLX5_ARAVE|nr:hypothetical protein AVEN_215733-1 [Araneus ventricosus]